MPNEISALFADSHCNHKKCRKKIGACMNAKPAVCKSGSCNAPIRTFPILPPPCGIFKQPHDKVCIAPVKNDCLSTIIRRRFCIFVILRKSTTMLTSFVLIAIVTVWKIQNKSFAKRQSSYFSYLNSFASFSKAGRELITRCLSTQYATLTYPFTPKSSQGTTRISFSFAFS